MARYKTLPKKLHLSKEGKRTKYAPFWTVFKVFGKGKKIHPAVITKNKRSWRRKKLRIKPFRQKRRRK